MTSRVIGRRIALIFTWYALISGVSASCALNRSKVAGTALDGRALTLRALSPAAAEGILEGSDTAWLSFNPARSGTVSRDGVPIECTLLVDLVNESSVPATVSLGAMTGFDISRKGNLSASPGARPLAVADSFTGKMTLGLVLSASSDPGNAPRGFAVGLAGKDAARVRILHAAIVPPESGWSRRSDEMRLIAPSAGGLFDVRSFRAGVLPPVSVPDDSVVTFGFAGAGSSAGTIERQSRAEFRGGSRDFCFRKIPGPHGTSVPSFIFPGGEIAPDAGTENLMTITVAHGKKLPVADSLSPSSPISADPSLVIEWPQARWRRSEFEVFSWDSFPTVLIYDTADYAVQDALFKRLAFFVEKEGYRGKLMTDAELSGLHAYNAHDYRAESLASFFDAASRTGFALGAMENDLRDVLVAEGIIVKKGQGFAAGAGAVLSISRESVPYLRYLFMAHEGYHGIYFIDPDFRAEMSRVYRAMDPRAVKFLETYFTVVDSLGYDTGDPYLMENELMAYLLQQPLDRVSAYFTGVISERYLRHGGDSALADYIADTDAQEFVRAAGLLNDYAFSRWGLAGGRVGLYVAE